MTYEPRPRLTAETRQAAVSRVLAALRAAEGDDAHESLLTPESGAEAAVDAVIDVLWRKLRGDAQDRINGLIEASKGVVDRKGGPTDGLAKALRELAGYEVAATSTKQLKEGPWHGG